uniref:Meteorin like, glial cell differentiation regulator a n=1 Tax=Eptatretus burgeri TaxID=7764 RepID=A0A8C4NCZ8_EPTBU
MMPRSHLPLLLLLIRRSVLVSCSEDPCVWKGSGLSHEVGSRDVEQLYLSCSQGALTWLYPTGALRLLLRPGTIAAPSGPVTACIQPNAEFAGANIYLEHKDRLQLLVDEHDLQKHRHRRTLFGPSSSPENLYCFSGLPLPAVFVQATPHADISRRVASFRFELQTLGSRPVPADLLNASGSRAVCRPCNNTELLLAVCTSDVVVKGLIRSVKPDVARGVAAIEISTLRIFRQKEDVFSPVGQGQARLGTLWAPLCCGVRKGDGAFLFTASLHFGEAWLSCAPRYHEFRKLYKHAQHVGINPCEISLN